MRYAADHKARTHARILDEAARAFRTRGYDGVGIADIMAAADLTRGGFYAHFDSKEGLFAEVMGRQPDFHSRVEAAQAAAPAGSAAGVRRVFADYLTPEHLDRISAGCAMASNTQDVRRAGPRVRKAFTDRLRAFISTIAGYLRGEPSDSEARALAALATAVGGVIIARAIDDERLMRAMLDACRERALRELADESPKLEE